MDSVSEMALDYVSALGENPENLDSLRFHASLLLGQLAALDQVDSYHRSYPWRCVQALDHGSWGKLLSDMKSMWEFVLAVPDQLRSTEALYKELMVTRYQAFRDVFVKCEHLG